MRLFSFTLPRQKTWIPSLVDEQIYVSATELRERMKWVGLENGGGSAKTFKRLMWEGLGFAAYSHWNSQHNEINENNELYALNTETIR